MDTPQHRSYQALPITHLDDEARGIGHLGDRTILVPGAAPGDVIDATVVASSQHHPIDHATIQAVISRGDAFVQAPCAHAAPTRGQCGGCPAMHLSPDAQRTLKLGILNRALAHRALTARLPSPTWHPAPAPLAYRNRGHYVPTRGEDGRATLGAFAPRSHEVVETLGCLIVRPAIDAAAIAIAALLNQQETPIHPAPDALRHVTLRAAPDGSWVADLVLTADQPAWLDGLTAAIMASPGACGVSTSTHADSGNAIRTQPSVLRAGTHTITEALATDPQLTVALSADAFFQLNAEVAAQMYTRAAKLDEGGAAPGVVWDLYCGVGGLGLVAAKTHGARLFGAESHAASVEQARQHADAHGVEASFEVRDLSKPAATAWPAPDLILVNPPRRGLDTPVLDLICARKGRLVYMSCNPTSFARDALRLLGAGWVPDAIEAHDMLPQTAHVELLSTWTRR